MDIIIIIKIIKINILIKNTIICLCTRVAIRMNRVNRMNRVSLLTDY